MMPTTDQQLLAKFFQYHRSSWKSYEEGAQLLWQGEHYVLVRTGLGDDKSRDVYLVDKMGLLIDEESPPLTQLAVGYHPSQNEQAQQPELIHCSLQESQEDNETFLRGRWCKKRCREAIAYAKRKDVAYDTDFQDRAEAYEAEQRKIKEGEERAAAFLAAAKSLIETRTGADEDYADTYRPSTGPDDGDWYRLVIDEGSETVIVDSLSVSLSQLRRILDILTEKKA